MSTIDDIREAIARAGDGGVIIGADGRVAGWNAMAERLLGYTARDVVGRPCCEVFGGVDPHGDHLCHPECHIRVPAAHHEPIRTVSMRTRTKTGREVWLDVSVLTLPAAGDVGPVTVHLFRDVTETRTLLTLVRKRLETSTNGRPPSTLSRRELQVLRLLAEGLDTKAAAARLNVSRATIRNHVQNLCAKLGVHSRLEAVAYATKHRLT
jgi:PAS domain S-box-containing protein